MKLSLVLLASSLLTTGAFAQTDANTQKDAQKDFSGNLTLVNQERYLGIGSTKEIIQDNITIKATVDLHGVVEIHSLVQTGNSYTVGYNNLYDLKTQTMGTFNGITQLYLKQIYLKKAMDEGKIVVSAGALDTGNSIAQANALSNLGWVDGVRAELTTAIGNMTLNAGQIKSADPSVFDRANDFSVNYFEITLKRKVFNKILAEVGVQRFEDKNYIEAATKTDLEVAAGRVLHLAGDAKVELENGAYKVAAGLQDILSLFHSKINVVKLSVNYEYVSSKFDTDMKKLNGPMHTGYTGGAVVTTAQFPISKAYGVNGFTNLRVGSDKSDFRTEIGVNKTLFNKTFKRK